MYSVFQLDFEIFRTVVSFIKISSGHSLVINTNFYKVLQDNLRNRWANVLRPVPILITGIVFILIIMIHYTINI